MLNINFKSLTVKVTDLVSFGLTRLNTKQFQFLSSMVLFLCYISIVHMCLHRHNWFMGYLLYGVSCVGVSKWYSGIIFCGRSAKGGRFIGSRRILDLSPTPHSFHGWRSEYVLCTAYSVRWSMGCLLSYPYLLTDYFILQLFVVENLR